MHPMKKQLKQLHLSLALSVGIFILLQSISGSLLTFGKEIQRTLSPQSWTIEPEPHAANTEQLIAQLQRQADQENITIKKIYLETDLHLAWQATMSNGEQWNLNPYTGEIIDRFRSGEDFYSFTLHFHRWLLINAEPGRSWARHLTSTVATVFIIQIFIGLLLWLTPRKRALRRLKLKSHKTVSATLIQWHLIIGVYAGPALILIACCGIGFNWPVISKLVEWSTASTIERPAKHKPVKVGGITQWPIALANAQHALPQGQLHRIYFPQQLEQSEQPEQPLTLRYQLPEESHPFSYVWLDGGSGEVLGVHDASVASTATRVWNFKYKFHIGDFAGLPIRVLWLLLSLVPTFFVVSGVWLWWRKRKRRVDSNQNKSK